jgi:hypothetical protein
VNGLDIRWPFLTSGMVVFWPVIVTSDSTDNFNHLRAETPRPELLVLSSIASETGVGTAFSNVEMR